MEKPMVEITGAWLRVGGGKAQLLVEVGGTWRVAIEEKCDAGETVISHIVEPGGILRAPFDPVTE